MQQVIYTDFGQGTLTVSPKKPKTKPLVILAYLFLFPFLLIAFMILGSLFPWTIASMVVVLVVVLLIYGSKKIAAFDSKIKRFAKTNGWETGTDSPLIPTMKKLGYNSQKSMVSGSIDDLQFWFYECRPPVWQKKGRDLQVVIFLSIKFPKELPTLLLIPNAGLAAIAFDKVAKSEFGLIPMTLEGDFSSKVHVYGADGEQVNVLEYLTPDVMDVVMRNVDHIVLYSGEYLSISTNQQLTDGFSVKELFDDAQILIKELKEKMRLI